MIIIKKSRAGFRVVHTGGNNEVLSNSEVLKTKQSCWKNIYATSKNFCDIPGEHYHIMVWDKTTGKQSQPVMVDLFSKFDKNYRYRVEKEHEVSKASFLKLPVTSP